MGMMVVLNREVNFFAPDTIKFFNILPQFIYKDTNQFNAFVIFCLIKNELVC